VVSTFVVSTLLLLQLVAAAAWTSDSVNQGPTVVILQLSDDSDTRWAVADLEQRLSQFIVDDPYLVNRVVLRRTNNPHIARDLSQSIVIYVSHGGPFGIVTGKRLTSWKTMADIVTDSKASMHLFAACDSRNLIRYGSEESGKKLYTVPGARPAEVTNVEIVATVMLALGLDTESVDEYRTSELIKAKKMIEAGMKIHIMDFEEIILSEIEQIDATYNETWTSSYRVYRDSIIEYLTGGAGFTALPFDLKYVIDHYYAYFCDFEGVPYVLQLDACWINYTKNYYYEAWWRENSTPPLSPPEGPGDQSLWSTEYVQAMSMTGGYWEYGPHVFTGGTYSGFVVYEGIPDDWVEVYVNVTASGPTLDANNKTEVDSIALRQLGEGGQYVQQQKVDGVWEEPVVGRNPSRTGGLWTDPATKADYEYDSSWPELPYMQYSMKEDAEDGDTAGWHVYDNNPPGSIYNVIDNGGRAISLVGGGIRTGYKYPYPNKWNDAEHKSAQWSMKYSESYYVFFSCDTTSGHRYIYYTNVDYDILGTGQYVHHGLGSWTTDGDWHTFTRNLEDDLHDAQPSVDIIDINAILFRGSGRVDNIMLLTTEYEAYGEIDSNGEHISVSSIPTGDGWHGPTFARTLPSYFEVRDFGSFSANLSLVHAGDENRQGTLSVSLFDEDMKIVASLQMRDMWGSEEKVKFYAYYYFEDGTYWSDTSSYFYGDTNGIVTMRYNPLIGMHADFPEESESLLVANNLLDPDRVIKFIAIQCYRYDNYAEHDERIYNVRISYAGSEFTVFHDNCNDMDQFHQDLSFPNGTLEVPAGESYMTWTSIDSGSGWHGPQYAHTLDRPFRLYQLFEFSVFAELIQGAGSEMGITSVALLDDYGEQIMAIEWGDDSSGWTDGWFRVVYYPQNGGEHIRTLWYGENSYAVTISMWWDPATSQGSIYTGRSDNPYSYLVHAVYNASRVVESLIIEGQRYGSSPLVDMRIHDINVVADLNRHDPNDPNPEEPAEYDGTNEGRYEDPFSSQEVSSFWSDLENVCSQTASWWEGAWPRIHLKLIWTTLAGGSAILHFSVDLLMDLRFEDSVIDTPLDDQMTENQKNDWALSVAAATTSNTPQSEFFKFLGWAMVTSLAVLSFFIAVTPFPDPWKFTAILYHFGVFSAWLGALLLAVHYNWISAEYLVGLMAALLDTALTSLIVLGLAAGVLLVLQYVIKIDVLSIWPSAPNRLIWGIIGIGYYFFIVAIMWLVWIQYLEISLAGYLGVSL
jgi:hypothetical protein